MKITINGQDHSVDGALKNYVMYEEVKQLASMRGTPSMTWRIRGTNEGGIVEPLGEKAVVALREGLVFNVAHTGNA